MALSAPHSERDAAKKLRESSTIAIVLPEFFTLAVAGSATALLRACNAMQKTVTVFGPPLLAERVTDPGRDDREGTEPLREFIISFDLTRSPIKELRYERAENRLNIILSPTGPRIARDDIEFRYGALRYDCVVALGVPSPEAATHLVHAPELLHEKFVINIDTNPANRRYGDINLIVEGFGSPTLPELVYQLLTDLAAPLRDPTIAGPLLAALANATHEFRLSETSAEGFRIASELMAIPGALPSAAEALAAKEYLPDIQLAARAIARSRMDTARGVLWSLLLADDFRKTGTSSSSLPETLRRLDAEFRAPERIVAMSEHPDTGAVQAHVLFRDPKDAEAHAGGSFLRSDSAWMLFREQFPSVTAAEERIAALLPPRGAVQYT